MSSFKHNFGNVYYLINNSGEDILKSMTLKLILNYDTEYQNI